MITENCILKNMDECPCRDSEKIVDRTGVKLPILRDGTSCRSIVCNAVPVFMGDRVSMLEKVGVSSVQLLFTVETPNQCQKISSLIFSGRTLDEPYTRGHFVKGIHGA